MDGWMDGEYAEVCSDLEQQALELKQNRALIDSINSSTKVCICVLQLHHIKADEHDKIDIHNGCNLLCYSFLTLCHHRRVSMVDWVWLLPAVGGLNSTSVRLMQAHCLAFPRASRDY